MCGPPPLLTLTATAAPKQPAVTLNWAISRPRLAPPGDPQPTGT
jgi:hypothetical protein